MQLPYDVALTPHVGCSLATHTFTVAVNPALEHWAAAWAAMLARYSSQAAVPMRLSIRDGVTETLVEFADELVGAELVADLKQRIAAAELAVAGALITPGAPNDAALPIAGLQWRPAAPENSATIAAVAHLCLVLDARDLTHAELHYNSQLWVPATIERAAEHVMALLVGIMSRPDALVLTLPMLSEAELAELASIGTGPRRSPAAMLLHEQIEFHAAHQPDAIAVRFGKAQLTYGELNAAANRLARYLRAHNVAAEARVLVCLEPSVDIAVIVLAIQKAGAVYVPLDPGYPLPRSRAILDDAEPAIVVGQAELLQRLELSAYPHLAIDQAGDELDVYGPENLNTVIAPAATAYVYFTSGTTGLPKGVMASYQNLQHYIAVAVGQYDVSAADVMPAIARFSFSISMFELMVPLAAGGTLLVLERAGVLDVRRLADSLAAVTFFHAGPSLLKKLLPYIEQAGFDGARYDGVRHASSGGDLIAPELLETVKRVFRNAEVFVIYGCSEIACMGCTYPVLRDQRLTKTFVGKPFANTSVRLFDGNLQPVPLGVVGEICFAGAGVAKGYLRRPDLTAKKIVQLDGQRWYRTGDMGRRGADGWVEILGRRDFQVKVRGMRIELGEVEFHVRQVPGVRDGVVLGQRDASSDGDLQLVAYVVLDESVRAEDSAMLVRRYLTQHVPDYMVPARVVVLPALPLNQNLKVDRAALLRTEPGATLTAGAANDGGVVSPRLGRTPTTPSQLALAAMWCALLARTEVSLNDNFFELGADSLLAMNLIVEIERTLGVVIAGIDVLRESLEILAVQCDQLLGRATPMMAASGPGASGPRPSTVLPLCFGHGHELYGALHVPGPAQPKSDFALLLCGPLGHEVTRTHLILTKLARVASAAGVATLRFDFFACGDSAGTSLDATPMRWQRDLVAAATELRTRTGCQRVIAVGVRAGAALLAIAAETAGIEQCVYWDPVWRGADYLQSHEAMHAGYRRGTGPVRRLADTWLERSQRQRGHESLGMTYNDAAQRQLHALKVAGPTAGDEVLQSTTVSLDCGWSDAARIDDIIPDPGISQRLWHMVTAAATRKSSSKNALATQAVAALAAVPATSRNPADPASQFARGVSRGTVLLGHDQHLVALLTLPRVAPTAVCILINAGLVPKFGPHRLYAELAARLAENGVATLCLDVAGIGDSVHEATSYPLAQRMARDIGAAVEFVSTHHAPARIVVAGLCSGSEDALRYAASDARIAGAVMIDSFGYPTAGWRWRNVASRATRRGLRALGAYQPLSYQRVLINGGVQQGQNVVRYRYMAQPEAEPLLATLLARGAALHFCYSGGNSIFNHRRQMAEMFPALDTRAITVDYFAQLEHTQLLAADREALITAIVDGLRAAAVKPSVTPAFVRAQH